MHALWIEKLFVQSDIYCLSANILMSTIVGCKRLNVLKYIKSHSSCMDTYSYVWVSLASQPCTGKFTWVNLASQKYSPWSQGLLM